MNDRLQCCPAKCCQNHYTAFTGFSCYAFLMKHISSWSHYSREREIPWTRQPSFIYTRFSFVENTFVNRFLLAWIVWTACSYTAPHTKRIDVLYVVTLFFLQLIKDICAIVALLLGCTWWESFNCCINKSWLFHVFLVFSDFSLFSQRKLSTTVCEYLTSCAVSEMFWLHLLTITIWILSKSLKSVFFLQHSTRHKYWRPS